MFTSSWSSVRNTRLVKHLAAAAAFTLLASTAWAQALTPISSLRVSYNTRKTVAKPQGALKTEIDEIDRQIAEATRLGRYGEVRRLYAKGQARLAGREWTDVLEFTNSIAIRTERVLADSTGAYTVRLEQIYAPAITLERPLTAHATLRKRPAAGRRSGGSGPTARDRQGLRRRGQRRP